MRYTVTPEDKLAPNFARHVVYSETGHLTCYCPDLHQAKAIATALSTGPCPGGLVPLLQDLAALGPDVLGKLDASVRRVLGEVSA